MKQFRGVLFGIFAKRELESRRLSSEKLSPFLPLFLSLFPCMSSRAREDNFKYSRKISFRHFAPIKSRIPRVERSEKNEEGAKKPGRKVLGTSISLKSAQRERREKKRDDEREAEKECPSRKWRLRIPACARLKENIFIKFMPASTSARVPVNRFPEDVDQFRLERRREMRERER